MAEVVRVVVDAMGGDYAPVEPVKAAVEAVKERDNIRTIRRTGSRWSMPQR